MADTLRDKFFEAQASAALWDVAVSLKRGNALPLDANSVFKSMADVDTYRNGGGPAYPGQVLAIVEASQTKIYYLDQELNVQPVGIIPTGIGAIDVTEAGQISVNVDNKSIESINDKISMHDFGVAYYEYVPEVKDEEGNVTKEASYAKVEVSTEKPWKAGLEPKVVTENGELVIGWFEPNPTTIEGVNDQVTAVQGTVADLEVSVGTPSAEGKEATGLYKEVEDVQTEVEELADSVGSSEDSLGEDVNTLWANVNDHSERIEALEGKEDKDTTYTAKADDKVLKLNGTEFYTQIGLKHENGMISLTGVDGAVIAEFSDSDFVKDGFLSKVELVDENPNLEGEDKTVGAPFLKFTWNSASVVDSNITYVAVGELVDIYHAGNGLSLTDNKFAVKIDESSETFLTVGANGVKLAGVQAAIDTAKQAAIDAAAADAKSKADAAQAAAITAAAEDATTKAGTAKSEAIADAATKYYGKGEIYTKSEIDDLLEGIQGGASESAASVKTQLDAYKKVVNAEVWGDEAGAGVDGNSRIDILDSKVKALEDVGAQANVIEQVKGVDDNRLSISTAGKVVTIDDANLRIDIANAKKAGDDAASVAGANAQAISGHDKRIGDLETAKNAHDESILALQGEDNSIKGRLTEVENKVNNETTGLAATYAKTVQNATDVATLVAKDKIHDEDIAALKTSTGNNATAITNLQTGLGNVYTKTESDGKYATIANMGTPAEGKTIVQMIADAQAAATYNDTQVKADIKTNADAIAVINGEAEGSIKKAVKDLADGAVAANAKAIADEKARAEAAEKVNADAIAAEKSRAEAAEKVNADAIAAEIERAQAAEKANADAIERLTNGVSQEEIDSVNDLINYVNEHGPVVKGMQDDIAANASAITAINHETTGILAKAKGYTDAEVAKLTQADADGLAAAKAYTNDEIAKLTNSETGILANAKAYSDANLATAKSYADSAAAVVEAKIPGVDDKTIKLAENKAYVAEVSTDILVQGEVELIFSAGNANGYNK